MIGMAEYMGPSCYKTHDNAGMFYIEAGVFCVEAIATYEYNKGIIEAIVYEYDQGNPSPQFPFRYGINIYPSPKR